jgi:hypothetical protein
MDPLRGGGPRPPPPLAAPAHCRLSASPTSACHSTLCCQPSPFQQAHRLVLYHYCLQCHITWSSPTSLHCTASKPCLTQPRSSSPLPLQPTLAWHSLVTPHLFPPFPASAKISIATLAVDPLTKTPPTHTPSRRRPWLAGPRLPSPSIPQSLSLRLAAPQSFLLAISLSPHSRDAHSSSSSRLPLQPRHATRPGPLRPGHPGRGKYHLSSQGRTTHAHEPRPGD